MLQVRRYDPQALVRCVRSFGGDSVGIIPFMESEARPRGQLMVRKQLPQLQHAAASAP